MHGLKTRLNHYKCIYTRVYILTLHYKMYITGYKMTNITESLKISN